MTPSTAQPSDAPDARVLITEATGQPHGAAVTETYLTMAGLRERGWTDAMIWPATVRSCRCAGVG